MITTIDKGGRVVVPKAMRDALGLKPGSEVEVQLDVNAGSIAIAPRTVPKRLEMRDGFAVIVPESPLPPVTVEDVRDLLERLRDKDDDVY
jgi:AbrB family looped-hinge helix DNA binding protein